MTQFAVYVIYSSTLNRFYTGTTDCVDRRLKEHNAGIHPDSFSKKGIPWQLYLSINGLSSIQAKSIEKHIKTMKSSIFIKNLKEHPELMQKLIIRFK
jgi:putative endonuclease